MALLVVWKSVIHQQSFCAARRSSREYIEFEGLNSMNAMEFAKVFSLILILITSSVGRPSGQAEPNGLKKPVEDCYQLKNSNEVEFYCNCNCSTNKIPNPESVKTLTYINRCGNGLILKQSDFADFKQLEKLNTSSAGITSIDESNLSRQTIIRTLREWVASHNQIKNIPENFFLNVIRYVKTIDLSCNQFDPIKNETILITNVETLNLSNNNIRHLHKNTFDEFRNLKSLDLSNNQITTISNEVFKNMTQLQNLFLEHNLELKSFTYNIFPQSIKSTINVRLPKESIEILDVSFMCGDSKDECPVNVFEKKGIFDKIEKLNASGNHLNNEDVRTLLNSLNPATLLRLDLSQNNIVNLTENMLGRFTQIYKLYLKDTNLSELDDGTFVNYEQLQIDLSNNKLKNVNLGNSSKRVERLQELCLDSNPLENVNSIETVYKDLLFKGNLRVYVSFNSNVTGIIKTESCPIVYD